MTVSRQLALCIMFLFGLSIHNFAQVRQCGTMEYLEQQIRDNPERALRLQSIDRQADQVQQSLQRGVSATVVIPTVVHIVYRSSSQNISDAQVQSQIDVLNEDFRRLNADAANTPSVFQGVAADTEIEFCLASVDPNGNPTSGITRTASTRTSAFGTNDAVKFASSGGKDAWPAGDYLNIWVCEIGGGILGYAQFPGGSAATDGVVLDYRYTGRGGSAQAPFDLGRTGTHEVGHWLNLRHIWGDGNCNADDFVGDTPTAGAPNYTGSPCTFPGPNSCNQGAGDLPDMFQNYMDYSDDACMNLYTQGQKTRMLALFQPGGFRASLLGSNGCGQGAPPTCTDGIQNGNETGVDCGGSSCPACPCFGNALTLSITLDNYPTETTWRITNSGGSIVASGGPYTSSQRNTTVTQNINLTGGDYTFTILDSYGDGICCAYGNGSYTLSDGTSTIASGGAFGSSESTPFCTGSSGPSCTDGIQNGDETGVDCGGSCPACPVICDTPAGLSATPAGDQASLSWSPANGALNYNVRARQVGTSTWTEGSNLTPPVNYTGLAACTDYEFQVQSNCSGGTTSNWSASYTFTTTGCSGCAYSTINSSNFDGGWGIWADGGTDCARVNNSTYANSGSYSIQLRDNTYTSVMTTGNLNLTAYSELTVDFTYVAVSMDNSSEDFWLQISTNGGSTYTTVEEWNRGDEFVNNVRYFDAVVIPGPFTANTRLRFRCDASADNDYVYIDDVVISGCGGGARQGAPELAGAGEAPAANEEEHREQAEPDRLSYMKVFPNPATDELSAVFNQQLAGPVQMTVVSTTGQAVYRQAFQADAGRQEVILDVSRWTPGVYVLHLVTDGRTMTQKFVVTGE